MEPTVIAVDAMGGDNAPGVVLDGCAQALAADDNLRIMLCGPAEVVEPFAEQQPHCEAVVTTEVIDMGEHPANAVRRKKDSSLVVGCRLVKEGKAKGFFSAGSTGACLSAATLVMGRVKGIKRPCLATVVPSPVKPCVLTDIGANADCKPEYLVQFAIMGRIYCRSVLGVQNPTVGLLNIGEEETKGSEFAQLCHAALKDVEGFQGNAEGHDVVNGTYDLVVTDGFTGNVCLKTIEGTSKMLFSAIKNIMMTSLKTKVGALCIKGDLYKFKDTVSADTYGGAPLLGVKGGCMVGHGSSNATAIKNGVAATATMVREDLPGQIMAALASETDADQASEGGE
ncbi:MAG: phosphate acyltransferase PlsX [Coriobacteriia bacterium]|nr:phosphate acyltransferase PlsX [Coriobacteriia bacterium]